MNPRITTIVIGIIMLALGLASLLYPERIMGLLGFAPLNTSHAAAVLGEIRATYGGLFVVMGVFTLLAGMDPPAHRGRIMFVGLMWLGACAGRLIGAYLDGNPGVPGWLTAVFEVIIGGALVAASFSKPQRPAPPQAWQAPRQPASTPPPVPPTAPPPPTTP